MNRVVLAFNYFPFSDKKKENRQSTAIAIACANSQNYDVKLVSFNYEKENIQLPEEVEVCKTLTRNSRNEIGNNRDLPYIKDIFDRCMEFNCDIIGYMNSDILLHDEFFSIFDSDKDAYIFYRREIDDVDCETFNDRRYKLIWGGDKHPGNDAFFFRKDWWIENRDSYPDDLILGETEWDTVYRVVTKNITDDYVEPRELCHVYHNAKWTLDSPGAKNNIEIWNETKQKHGMK